MQVLPFYQVKDLAPSASFYAAICQPLGLRYISATPTSIVFGDADSPSPDPVFEVKKSFGPDYQRPQPCRIVLSARTASAVSAFHAAALRANPDLHVGDINSNANFFDSSGESSARIGDFDGNIMEVIHNSRPGYAASHAGSAVSRAQSSHEVSRVLDWNLDVGSNSVASRSVGGSVAGSRGAGSAPYSFLQRSITTSTVESSPSTPNEESKGLGTTGVVGSILGAAVGIAMGGALTYSMLNKDREKVAFQEYEQPPPFVRRTTCPDQYPDSRPRYVEYPPGKYPPSAYSPTSSQSGGPRGRVVEELDDRSSRHSSHYTTGSKSRGRSEAPSARRPLMITDHEHRSNAGSRHGSSRHGDSRHGDSRYGDSRYDDSRHGESRYDDPRYDDPRHSESPSLLADSDAHSRAGSRHSADNRSQAGSRYTAAPSRRSPEADLHSYVSAKHTRPREAEVETYVSARTERSDRTVRPALARYDTAPSQVHSHAPSRYSSATARPAPISRAHSHLSARHVPQPESSVGSSADWEDVCSVAPSDSISNVGGLRHGRRSYYA
ncbi:hypothetical protein F4819DRAFT_243752 [Hypoxylon fuscum]|nr:hypothetical protein F4819DRAFT_243752 [Hypoxylon fuscum]